MKPDFNLTRRILAAEARMFEAEALLLEQLARWAPRKAGDPKWLKAAARKQCCAAELIRALAKKEKILLAAGGEDDNGAPNGSGPRFQGDTFAPFESVLETHNGNKRLLMQWRELFGELAGPLTGFLKERLGATHARGTPSSPGAYADVLPDRYPDPSTPDARRFIRSLGHVCTVDPEHLREVFRDEQGGAGAGPNVFDRWAAKWRGKWTSNRGRTDLRPWHLWDQTRTVGQQSVQPVTQSDERLVDENNIDTDPDQEGVQLPPDLDLAVNVYDGECGVTGWVTKRHGGRIVEQLPSLGYRVDDGKLIWISQKRNPDGSEIPGEPFILFYEWVDERGCYGILGIRFKIEGEGDDRRIVLVEYDGEQHVGLYEKVE